MSTASYSDGLAGDPKNKFACLSTLPSLPALLIEALQQWGSGLNLVVGVQALPSPGANPGLHATLSTGITDLTHYRHTQGES